MRVLVDDREVLVDRPTLAAALEAARQTAERRGRVVVEALMDGNVIPDGDLAAPGELDRRGAEMRFVTADPLELVRATLGEIALSLEGADADHAEAAGHIQAGRLDEGLTGLRSVLATWDQTQQAVAHGLELLNLNPSQIGGRGEASGAAGGTSLEESIVVLSTKLRELKAALSMQDWSSVADALAYDLREQAKQWSGHMSELARTLDQGGGSPLGVGKRG